MRFPKWCAFALSALALSLALPAQGGATAQHGTSLTISKPPAKRLCFIAHPDKSKRRVFLCTTPPKAKTHATIVKAAAVKAKPKVTVVKAHAPKAKRQVTIIKAHAPKAKRLVTAIKAHATKSKPQVTIIRIHTPKAKPTTEKQQHPRTRAHKHTCNDC